MHTSPIIDELHAVRRRYAERFGDDLHAICEDARRKQAEHGRPVVPLDPKRLTEQDLEQDHEAD
jgi:hypothetical protein